MRQATLKTYTKNKLMEYYKKPLRFSNLLKDSASDARLAEVSQAYYLAMGEQEKADAFSVKTTQKFSCKEFPSSNQKYAWQFNNLRNAEAKGKEELRELVLYKMKQTHTSFYGLSKFLQTSQSNVDCFFKKKDDKKMSIEQLLKLDNYLKSKLK